jgi:putative transposase
MARAVLPGLPHHLTQRGVDRQPVFFTDVDRHVYLDLIHSSARRFQVSLLGYCLMSNHVHWIAIPAAADSLAQAFGEAHGRYAQYANSKLCRAGHFWQNRFFSCALDPAHLWAALRYVERNPVRARLVEAAEHWPWSSARTRLVQCGPAQGLGFPQVSLETWRMQFSAEQWRSYLAAESLSEAELALRVNTYTGRPVGSRGFVQTAEAILHRPLLARKGGRPRKTQCAAAAAGSTDQASLFD